MEHPVKWSKPEARRHWALHLSNFSEVEVTERVTLIVKVLFSKMTFEMAQFSIFGANLRNFDLFDLIEEGLGYLDPLKPLTPIDPLMSN